MEMSLQKFFGGRVEIKSLERTDRPANRAQVQARILSPKGELAVLLDGVTPILYLAHLEMRAGVLRGNHFHKLRNEQFYVLEGKVALQLENVETREQAIVELQAGDLAFIGPGIAHALLPLIQGAALEFAREAFDPNDVYPHVIEIPIS